jgi:DnaJ-class molecular chaperone
MDGLGMNNESLKKVTRLETIDHTKCDNCHGSGRVHIEGQTDSFECPACHGVGTLGRDLVFHNPNKEIELSVQDEGRTLKIFIKERLRFNK